MRASCVVVTALLAAALHTSPASAQTRPDERLDPQRAEQRLRDYVRVWEADERVGPRAMRAYYADEVLYYGKRLTRREVLADKLRFIRAFPERTYDIAPGSLRTRCDSVQCEARAVLVWRRATPSGRTREGASALTLVFSATDGGRIVQESATNLPRRR